jgi:hypothetical protein
VKVVQSELLVIRKQRLQAMLRGVVQRGTPKRAGGLEPPSSHKTQIENLGDF